MVDYTDSSVIKSMVIDIRRAIQNLPVSVVVPVSAAAAVDDTKLLMTRGEELLRAHEEYREFAVKYPTLFRVSCDENFPLDHLDFMLQTMRGIYDKSITDEGAKESVYTRLNKQYVDPLMGVDQGGALIREVSLKTQY
jgi:hypothetical protein